MSRQKSSPRFRFSGAALFLCILAFLVPALREGDSTLYLLAAAVPGAMILCMTVLTRMFSLDRIVLSLSLFLSSMGILAFSGDSSAALSQALRCSAGVASLVAGSLLVRSAQPSALTTLCSGFVGLLLLAGSLLSSSLSLPLSEAALVLLLISFASCFSHSGSMVSLLPALCGLALLLARTDVPLAVLWSAVFLLLLWSADGRLVPLLTAAGLVLLLFFGADRLLPAPLFSAPDRSRLSDFISAGLIGSDDPAVIPGVSGVSLLPRLIGRYGLLFACLAFLLYLPLSLRGASVACAARTRFLALLAMGSTLLIALQAISALLALFGFLPLPSFSLPFLTSSLPALCAQLFLAGMVCGVSGRNEADLAEDAHLAMLAK